MKRWISSACCTLCLVVAALLLPVWSHPQQPLREGAPTDKSTASTVALIQRVAAPPPPVVQAPPSPPPLPPHLPTVPSREEVPPEPVADTAETAEEPLQKEPLSEDTSASAPAATGSATDPAALQYRQYVLARIASKKAYPRNARTRGQEGRVRLQVVIDPDGRVVDCQMVSPSPHSLLNEASLLAVERAAPFKKMPAGMDRLTLTFAIDYSLTD
ncbi:MAG: TonB family protein [Spirochaetaceae bacterium]|nr:TonB family protein [Spirochaetaceae bacterium]